ncbi:transcription initiation factor IIB [Natronolimnohabitans innermongolicus]|uniref:Transcription initiation factor IIB n=1 Tax=Natronolimnohabitans innermongolicus JCM 12255 TaxID=1227499 RepID=L9X2B4_9EURY|nr:transcription initiation factor IIB family protein [Natronolimnohabitans innermongolicus]ELY55865.1 transcription factor TFIIB cyclin-related protein [Natronolimnohabitans innermongolicus JCM 12255]
MGTTQQQDRCPECSGTVRQSNNERICEGCGLVVGREQLDHGPEWRCGDGDREGARRTGAPLERSRHDRGLSTEIGFGTGTDISAPRKRQLVRMRKQHNQARFDSKADRNRAYGFAEIRRIVSALSLPTSLREQSCALFESAQSAELLYGRSLEGFAAACIYATCRVQSIARTIDEIVGVARADRNELKAAYDALNRELGLPVGPISPTEYLPRYATELEVEADVECRAREYVTWLSEQGRIGGKNPSGVAAACLYVAAYDHGVDVTQTELAELAGVSRMTIRSTVTDLPQRQ